MARNKKKKYSDVKAIAVQAHSLLHQGDVEGCHQLLHKICDGQADREAVEAARPALTFQQFDKEFQQLCLKYQKSAAYLAIKHDGNKQRFISGGQQDLSRVIDAAIPDYLGLKR